MPKFIFARNITREYYEVPAVSEAEARTRLEQDEMPYRHGARSTDYDEAPFELVDIEEETDAPV